MKQTEEKEWVVLGPKNNILYDETFSTVQQAIDYAIDSYDAARRGEQTEIFEFPEQDATFFVGYKAYYDPEIDAEWLIERLSDDANDFTCGAENTWLESVTEEEIADFARLLRLALNAWFYDNHLQPNIWVVKEAVEYDAYKLLSDRWEAAGIIQPYEPPHNQ